MSTSDDVLNLPSLDNDYLENEESTDDLEKALVIAAADADARSNEVQYAIRNDDSEDEEKEINNSAKVPESGSGLKRRLSVENEDPKHFKTNEGEVIPQPSEGYGKIIATHYNSLEEKGLDERSKSRIFYMRNFHNWIKSMLINEYLTKIRDNKKHNAPIRVMDMGCGKGGDLLKWRKGGISHLICADIASVSLDQCKSRYSDMQNRSGRDRNPGNIYSIEYIEADCTKVRLREKYKDPSMKLDLVSCQFVFHYSFESLTQAECMIHNAAECLQPGGFFIGTIPDANDLLTRVRKSRLNSFGNEVFQVTFESDINKPPLFGAKYNFHLDGVVDCPEFLVHFPTLIKLAKKYGLRLVRKEKFYEFYKRMNSEGRHLMGNMKGLEAYPPYPGSHLVGTAVDDYVHAEEFLRNEGIERDRNARIGTLSKSEWEASSLYITFAFEKVKNTWAADGTPIYDI
ncbi:hypothetical protein ILUMI_02465 [Ignelater luminosus]|uniref:mRNA cap guanine-N(7) methyltransferase n=1 Tax=Ignelater luminosus TaxID=2038154 RepID=A0A8K0DI78_IGNLU|nr:hypothetical protein ILUMI_02465 [Ignelater luminosus]